MVSFWNDFWIILKWRVDVKFHRGYGGFFNAISQLCPRAEENYSLAHKMGDLKMGDVHLIPVETEDNENDESKQRPLYIANLICQSRVAGRISGINMEKLALGLKKIALAAHAMKGKKWTTLGLAFELRTYDVFCSFRSSS